MRQSLILLLSLAVFLTGCGGGSSTGTGGAAAKPTVAFVTNGVAAFWTIADKGCKAAAKDLNVNVDVQMPTNGVGDQKSIIQNLLTRGISGIAISPIDPANQTEILDEAAARANLITHDSDAPNSKRLCYIGMDNYSAGRMCGQLCKEALPEGGKLVIFVGRIEQLNAKQRRQGFIDEILDRSNDPTRYDAPGQELKNAKYTILDTRTDQLDMGKALSQAQDAIAKYPDLACMVGLFEYNPPQCLSAIKDAGKIGKIKIVGFDENAATLQGIIDGTVYGTVVQNPYMYGYESVRILTALAKGDKSVLPKQGVLIDIPARKITKPNVDKFWTELKTLTGG
ncbi:MAG: sugar-binding protein [Planctomycetota bacterium]